MKFEFVLTKEDLLTFQLFTVSQTKRTKLRKRKMQIIVPVLYIIIGFLLFYLERIIFFPITFCTLSLIWLIFYPYFFKWRYKRHYTKSLEEISGDRFEKRNTVTIEGDQFLLNDDTTEVKIKITELEAISEIENYFYIKLKSAMTIILPKKQLNDKELNSYIAELSQSTGVTVTDQINWKW